MVKVDLNRDYYGDLELEPGASENDIKKQFKKLALKYHPDRNPGHEAEVNSKFQTIQSAHEVLTDVEQKAKYDANYGGRGPPKAYNYSSTTPTTPSGSATTSYPRGNPYSQAGSQWAPPPKPPPVRKDPPSAGARRYENFQPPGGPKRQEDPAEERKRRQGAYETMRKQQPKREWQPPKPVDPKYTPKSGREESNNMNHPPPPKSSRPGYGEFRAGPPPYPNRRSASPPSADGNAGAAPRRNGFMPSNLGGDEPPAANTSAYSTLRPETVASPRKSKPPDLPNRRSHNPDPLRNVKERAGTAYEERVSTPYEENVSTPYEERVSTPYAGRGGEKTTLHRSRSTRERSDTVEIPGRESTSAGDSRRSASQPRTKHHRDTVSSDFGPRVNSETDLATSPKRNHPYARNQTGGEPSRAQARYTPTPLVESETSSEEDGQVLGNNSFGTRARVFAKRRATRQTEMSQDSPIGPGKPVSSAEGNEDIPNEPAGVHKTHREESGGDKANPSMYDNPKKFQSPDHPAAIFPAISEADTPQISLSKASKFPTVSEKKIAYHNGCSQYSSPFATASSEAYSSKWPHLFQTRMTSTTPNAPSGVSLTDPASLNAFETAQFELLDELVVKRSGVDRPSMFKTSYEKQRPKEDVAKVTSLKFHGKSRTSDGTHSRQASASVSNDSSRFIPSSPREIRSPHKFGHVSDLRTCSELGPDNLYRGCITSTSSLNANGTGCSSFTFNVGDETFTARSVPRPFVSSSTENVSTTFSPDDWHGKFQAGDDYFGSDASAEARRARSGSRSGGRSPIRPSRRPQVSTRNHYANVDPSIVDAEKPVMSPRFSAEEWAHTFKQQTFAPPTTSSRSSYPARSGRRTRVGSVGGKPLYGSMTAGTAAMVDESESSEDNLLYMGQRQTPYSNPPNGASPNAMDIDPPLETEVRNVHVEPSRPEWRAGDANGLDAPTGFTPSGRPKLSSREPHRAGQRSTKSDDAEDFKTNLNDLNNVEPLQHAATGLNSFGDLNSTLPFVSKAASTVPISEDVCSGEIDLPKPPKAPMIPSIAQDAPRPTQTSWQSYLAEFKAYMAHWKIFNTTIIAHFVARRDQVDSMPAGWIEAFGESGIEKYKEGLKEDVKVREWWDVASMKHMAAVEEFMWIREVMKQGVQAAGSRPLKNY